MTNKKLKIIVANNAFSPKGGAEIIAYKTFKMLQNHGHDVYFWAKDEKPYFEENYEYEKFFTKYIHGKINYIKNPIRYYYDYNAKRDFKKLIDYVKPDLIHFHNVVASLYSCTKNIPSVLTIHGENLFCPSAAMLFKNRIYCSEHLCKMGYYIPCIKNKCVNNNIEASIRQSLLYYINNKQLKYIDKFITPSNALMDLDLSINPNLFANKIVTINNFLDNNALNTEPNYNNKGYFLYVGRLTHEKGIIYLLNAIKELPKEIDFHIIGVGPQEKELKQFVREHNLNNVQFLGFKNEQEIYVEYKNCIATITPSYYFENFPTTNMESFINGKPVIASNIGGISEQVEHNKTGLLFEPANFEQLRECILKYWNNNNLVIEHGKNAYEKARTLYTEERYYKRLMQVYNEVLERDK